MSVRCDASEAIGMGVAAVASLTRTQPRVMRRALEAVVAEERKTHAYKNRTGRLQKSTIAARNTIGNDDFVEVCILEDYASYVNKRGLMQIDERVARVTTELEYYFDGAAEEIGAFSGGLDTESAWDFF